MKDFDTNNGKTSRKPSWLSKRITYTDERREVQKLLHELGLNTVCKSARCPNLSECFQNRRATFMILGDRCTRSCTFCSVEKTGRGETLGVDPDEPMRIYEAVKALYLTYVVVTSVTRDDLADGGAGQFARVIQALRMLPYPSKIEVLTPDFQGKEQSIRCVAEAGPDVYNHNIETVPRLYGTVRPGADYRRSLNLLSFLKRNYPQLLLKSGLMVGMGEEYGEVLEVLRDLKEAGCDAVTIGQYLRPGHWNLPVHEYVIPETFGRYREEAKRMGFQSVAADPYVRSSYMAHESYEKLTRFKASSP